jgi:hypothetical protein
VSFVVSFLLPEISMLEYSRMQNFTIISSLHWQYQLFSQL